MSVKVIALYCMIFKNASISFVDDALEHCPISGLSIIVAEL